MSDYPGGYDDLPADHTNKTLQKSTHPTLHNDQSDAINAIERTLGPNPQGEDDTVADRFEAMQAAIAGDTGLPATAQDHLAANVAVGATTSTVNGTPPPTGFMAIDAYTVNCELVHITSATGSAITHGALRAAHSSGAPVIFFSADRVPLEWFGAKSDGSDAAAAIQQGFNEAVATGLKIDGEHRTYQSSLPLILGNGLHHENMTVTAKSTFAPADANNALAINAQGNIRAFTAAAATDIFTTASAHGLPADTVGVLLKGTDGLAAGMPGGVTAGRLYYCYARTTTTFKLAERVATASVAASTNTLTTPSAHGLSDTDQVIVRSNSMPSGLSAGTVYFVRDSTPTTFKLAATSGGSVIDITGDGTVMLATPVNVSSDGAGTAYCEVYSLAKLHGENVYWNANSVARVAAKFSLQQQSTFRTARFDHGLDYGLLLSGQQADFYDLELVGSGVNLGLDNMSFLDVFGYNAEQHVTSGCKALAATDSPDAAGGGGFRNGFWGVHIEQNGASKIGFELAGGCNRLLIDGVQCTQSHPDSMFLYVAPGVAASYEIRGPVGIGTGPGTGIAIRDDNRGATGDLTFTALASTDTITTSAAHQRSNGEAVVFSGGSLPTGITAGVPYFIANATATTFTLVDDNGTAINLTADGSGTLVGAYVRAVWGKRSRVFFNTVAVPQETSSFLYTDEAPFEILGPKGRYIRYGGTREGVPNMVKRGRSDQTAPIDLWRDTSDNDASGVSIGGYLFTQVSAAPADGAIANGQVFWWIDTTAGNPQVNFKGKDSAGTVFTRQVGAVASGPAGGDLTGSFPNPTIGANKVTQAKASIGTGSTQLAGGDDARFPTTGQKNALAGTAGTPGTGNEYATKQATDLLAPLASPAFTGHPTGVTESAGDNSTRLASTAYVDTASGLLIPKSLMTTKGDLIGRDGSAPVRVGIGSDGQVLTADAASTPGFKWAAAAAPADASTSVKGITKITPAPASASNPIALGSNLAVGDLPQALIDALLPWRIEIMPQLGTIAMNGTVGVFDTSGGSTIFQGFAYSASNAQNNEFGWDVVLAAGTWTFAMMHQKAPGDAIATVNLGGSSVGTIDTYAAAQTYDNASSITGITVATTGKQRLSLKAATKNASSSGYQMGIQQIVLTRTA